VRGPGRRGVEVRLILGGGAALEGFESAEGIGQPAAEGGDLGADLLQFVLGEGARLLHLDETLSEVGVVGHASILRGPPPAPGRDVLRSAAMNVARGAPVWIAAVAVLAAGARPAHAEDDGECLTLSLSAAVLAAAQPEAGAEPEPRERADAAIDTGEKQRVPFGHAGSSWLTFGAMFAYDLGEEKDTNIHVAYSHFLADELEFAVQISGWYFAQDDDDTGGISGQMIFRWHAWHADDWDWSLYGEAGIGLLAGFDEVPNGGQEFNFVPRAAVGFTKRLWDDSPTRLQVGVGWHHISNGRYTGDVNNPSRDSVMVYAGIMIPF